MSILRRPSFYLFLIGLIVIIIAVVLYELNRKKSGSKTGYYIAIGSGALMFTLGALFLILGEF